MNGALPYPAPLASAVLVRRYKRFLADVRWPDGREETVHCPNPGRMTTCAPPGAPCRVSRSDNPRRKLPCTLEQVRVGDTWVHVHPARSNDVVAAALGARAIPALAAYPEIGRERPFPGGGRADFALGGPDGTAWVEVKTVTLRDGPVARFPDAVSARGVRHLARLTEVVAAGDRGVLLFVVARSDVDLVAPADAVDPTYGAALREAASAGVELLAYRCIVEAASLRIGAQLPISLTT